MTANETTFFNNAKTVFQEVDAVADGLGPRFNLDGCSGCHSQPAVGGSAPSQDAMKAQANTVLGKLP